MANQTISSDTNLDDLTGLLNGENITINSSAVLTIDNDSPVLIGAIGINDGTCLIDGRNVRHLDFTSGSGTLTVGNYVHGVTSGAYGLITADLSGTVRLRSVVSGPFNSSESLEEWEDTTKTVAGDWTATSSGADYIGFFTVVGEETQNIAGNFGAGSFALLDIKGEWYELGTGSGSASQTLTHFSDELCGAIWVETGSGTGVYEVWTNLDTTAFSTVGAGRHARQGTITTADSDGVTLTDSAATFTTWGVAQGDMVLNTTDGSTAIVQSVDSQTQLTMEYQLEDGTDNQFQMSDAYTIHDDEWWLGRYFRQSKAATTITLGDGTNGNIPPSGAKIRVPNIVVASSTTGSYPTTTMPSNIASRWTLGDGSAIVIDIDTCQGGGVYFDPSGCSDVSLVNFSTTKGLRIRAPKGDCTIDYVGCGLEGARFGTVLQISGAIKGTAAISNSLFFAQDNTKSIDILSMPAITITDCGFAAYGRTTPTPPFTADDTNNATYTRIFTAYGMRHFVGTNVSVTDCIYSPSMTGASDSVDESMTFDALNGLTINRWRFVSFAPDDDIVTITSSNDVTIKNIGSYTNQLDCASRTNRVGYFLATTDTVIANCHIEGSTNGFILEYTSDNRDLVLQNCSFETNKQLQLEGAHSICKGVIWGDGTLDGALGIELDHSNSYDSIYWNGFTSATVGWVVIMGNQKNLQDYYTVVAGTPRFNAVNDVVLPVANDELEYEWPHFILGYTDFQNVNVEHRSGHGANLSVTYAIDTGSGYGSFKSATGANLSGETITSDTGFKIKVRLKADSTGTGNANRMSALKFAMTTTQADQETLYPIRPTEADITITNLVTGSRVRVYNDTDAIELYNEVEATATFTKTIIHTADKTMSVRVRHASGGTKYKTFESGGTFTSNGLTIQANQELDQ